MVPIKVIVNDKKDVLNYTVNGKCCVEYAYKHTSFLYKLFRGGINLLFCNTYFVNVANICNDDIVIIFQCDYPLDVIRYIRKRNIKCRIIYYMFGSVADFRNNILYNRKKDFFRLLEFKEMYNYEVWSFDGDDCKKYNLNYNDTMFPAINMGDVGVKYDVVYIGYDKGRFEYLKKLVGIFEKYDIKTNFKIYKLKAKENGDDKFKLNYYMDYPLFLKNELEGKAILELVQDGQSNVTWRALEAVYYKRKLITNFKEIKKYPFYKKENIFILGEDNINNIKRFIYTPYVEISANVGELYSFKQWIKKFNISSIY